MGTDRRMDGRMDELTDGHKDHYIPPQICGGYKNRKTSACVATLPTGTFIT